VDAKPARSLRLRKRSRNCGKVELIERRRRDKSAGADILGLLMKARDHDCCFMTDGRGVARVGEGNLDPVVKETMA
jgi:hypothetical protein